MINLQHIAMFFNPIALREAKIAYNFGLSVCNHVKQYYLVCNESCLQKLRQTGDLEW